MHILILAYPLVPVGPAACGGSEQVVWQLSRRLAARRDCSVTWIAAPGSARVAGTRFVAWTELGVCPPTARPLWSPAALTALQMQCVKGVVRFLSGHGVDLVHDHGAWFQPVESRVPVLCTLHLSRQLYAQGLFDPPRPYLHLQLVSQRQQLEYPEWPRLPVVANGIDVASYRARRQAPAGDPPLLYLGRICPEKGPHLAIALAQRVRRRLWLVGAVAPFPDHQRYFERHVAPALNGAIRWLPPPSAAAKRRLLAAVAAVVIPSQIEETSSLVAMEAAASGVPALAMARGALPEIIGEGESGWLAEDFEGLVEAAARLERIKAAACRARAERFFDADQMAAGYRALYRQLAAQRHSV